MSAINTTTHWRMRVRGGDWPSGYCLQLPREFPLIAAFRRIGIGHSVGFFQWPTGDRSWAVSGHGASSPIWQVLLPVKTKPSGDTWTLDKKHHDKSERAVLTVFGSRR